MNPGWLWFWSIAWLVLLVIVILFNKGARVVRKLNRRRSVLAFLDKYAGFAIGLGLIAAYGVIHGVGS